MCRQVVRIVFFCSNWKFECEICYNSASDLVYGRKMDDKMDSTTVTALNSNAFTLVLVSALVAALVFLVTNKSSKPKRMYRPPPGPKPYPIIGNLASMQGYEIPYQAFNALAQKFGTILGLRLGSTPVVVLNDSESIKEVLITKASHFDNRPDWYRYNHLFNGNRQQCK